MEGHEENYTGTEDLTEEQYIDMLLAVSQTNDHLQDQVTAQLGSVWGQPKDNDYLRYGMSAMGQVDQGSSMAAIYSSSRAGSYNLADMAPPSAIRFTGGNLNSSNPILQASRRNWTPTNSSSEASLNLLQAAAAPAQYINSATRPRQPPSGSIASGRYPSIKADDPFTVAEKQHNLNAQSGRQTYEYTPLHDSPHAQRTTHPIVPDILVTDSLGNNAAPHDAHFSPVETLLSPQAASHSGFNRFSGYNYTHQGFTNIYQNHIHGQSMITPPSDFHTMHGDEQENKRRKLSHSTDEHVQMQGDPSPFHRQPSPFLEQAPFQDAILQHDEQLALDLQAQQVYATNRESKTHKRDVEIPINPDGKMICNHQPPFKECAGLTFERKCEWGKHMDKHERPYKCQEPGCEKLQGFTYSGGLLRHQREVHKAGGIREPLFCDVPGCKRGSGNGFTRKENLAEHKRRVHQRSSVDSTLGPNDVSASVEETLQASIQGLDPMHTPSHSHDTEQHTAVSPDTPTADHFIEPSLRSTSVKRKHTNIDRDQTYDLLIEENTRLRAMLADRDTRLARLEADNEVRDKKQTLMEKALQAAGLYDNERQVIYSKDSYMPNGSGA